MVLNRNIKNPFIINIVPDTPEKEVLFEGRRAYVPTNVSWMNFTSSINPMIQKEEYDSVIVHVNNSVDLDQKGTVHNISIKMNQICKTATDADKAVLSDASKDTWYFMNPTWADQSKADGYAPSDETILDKFHSYDSEMEWQKHQSEVWSRMADMMPLSTKAAFGTPNHLAQLTDPKRGLEKEDLDGFWSFKANKLLSPALMGDDMIGMPGIDGRSYDDFVLVTESEDGSETTKPISVLSIKTVGMSGITIPMANVDGNVPKYQIATDPSKINVALKARTQDGVSIQKSEYFNKKTNYYEFRLENGEDARLTAVKADENGLVTFLDVNGTFEAHMKDNVYSVLKERGYDLPPLIASLKVEPNAKYIWQSRGTMTGSEDVCKIVSPSNAGFIEARSPKNEQEGYVVLVAEGALKGHIVAKYVDVEDTNGRVFGDLIAGDKGIIVAQVPGVSRAFVESVAPVYEKYDVKGTYIAMDADGRENLAVANGIATAYECLSQYSPVSVMSWNPAQKGLDDALLAVSQKKITIRDMGISCGTPEKLFPKDQAKAPNPYKLDGTRANSQEWLSNADAITKATNEKIKAMQQATAKKETDPRVTAIQEETKRRAAQLASKTNLTEERANKLKEGGKDLGDKLPPAGPDDTKSL